MEVKNVKIAFQILYSDETAPNDFKFINCFMVFDVKMEDFHSKAHLVAGGCITQTPYTVTYSSVITYEVLCIA